MLPRTRDFVGALVLAVVLFAAVAVLYSMASNGG